ALAGATRAVDDAEQGFLAAVGSADRDRLRQILGELLADRWPSVVACED
ncbi:MarR family transcriptional regulator, partial [Streptomyces varsoviensis]